MFVNEALEVKYTESFDSYVCNPASVLSFEHNAIGAMFAQDKKYTEGFSGGVVYATNDPTLAAAYTKIFGGFGVRNFHFVIIRTTK